VAPLNGSGNPPALVQLTIASACPCRRFDRHLPNRIYTRRAQEEPAAAHGVWPAPSPTAAAAAVADEGAAAGGATPLAADDDEEEPKDRTGRLGVSAAAARRGAAACGNVNLQLRRHQHLYMGRSDVAGWGVFLREAVERGEFIQEYTGEQVAPRPTALNGGACGSTMAPLRW
jgi:hypothetical protein